MKKNIVSTYQAPVSVEPFKTGDYSRAIIKAHREKIERKASEGLIRLRRRLSGN